VSDSVGKELEDPIEELGQTQHSTQYSYDEYSNSQLVLVSDILEGNYKDSGTISQPHLASDLVGDRSSLEKNNLDDDVQWIKTVESIIREECPSGKMGLKPQILEENMNFNKQAVSEICKIVNNFNGILKDGISTYVTDYQLKSIGSTEGVSELLEYIPGNTLNLSKEKLAEWLEKNDNLDLIYQQNANAFKSLSYMKKYQIFAQLFETDVKSTETNYTPNEFNQMRNLYTVMKFAVDVTGGMGVFRYVDIPWYSYSRNKILRDYCNQFNSSASYRLPRSQQLRVEELRSEGEEYQVLKSRPQDQPQEINTQVFKCDLIKEELRSLNSGQWIEDSIITHYADYLLQKYNRTDTYVFQSTVIDQSTANVVPKNKKEYNYFLMPMHVKGTHWTLTVVHMLQKKIFYLDSLTANSLHHFDHNPMNLKRDRTLTSKALLRKSKLVESKEKIRERVAEIMQLNGYEEVLGFNWIECIMPLQKGGNDCGVFVLRYIEDFFNNEVELVADWIDSKNLQKRYNDEKDLVEEYRNRIRDILEQ
jgi:Ulp1 protease family, C-terminal catalytic domain